MVNTSQIGPSTSVDLGPASGLAKVYVVISVATLAAVALLSALVPRLATAEAWWHAAIVLVFAVLLPLRLRAARRGSVRALRATTIIAVVIFVVNVVEAVLPGVFPGWLRVDMLVVAGVMALLVVALAKARR